MRCSARGSLARHRDRAGDRVRRRAPRASPGGRHPAEGASAVGGRARGRPGLRRRAAPGRQRPARARPGRPGARPPVPRRSRGHGGCRPRPRAGSRRTRTPRRMRSSIGRRGCCWASTSWRCSSIRRSRRMRRTALDQGNCVRRGPPARRRRAGVACPRPAFDGGRRLARARGRERAPHGFSRSGPSSSTTCRTSCGRRSRLSGCWPRPSAATQTRPARRSRRRCAIGSPRSRSRPATSSRWSARSWISRGSRAAPASRSSTTSISAGLQRPRPNGCASLPSGRA